MITSANVITTDASLVGSHFLTSEDGEEVLTKIELDTSGDVSLKMLTSSFKVLIVFISTANDQNLDVRVDIHQTLLTSSTILKR